MKEYRHEFADYIYIAASAFQQLAGLIPVRAGCNRAKANYYVGPRVIECYSLHFVLEGSVTLSQGGRRVVLGKGDLFCLHPNRSYTYWVTDPSSASPLRMCWLAFEGSQAAALTERIGMTDAQPYRHSVLTSELESLLMQMMSSMRLSRDGDDLMLQACLYQMFWQLTARRDANGASAKKKDWLDACVQHIHAHYMEGISVADVVQVAGVHRSHLYSEFQRMFGISPQRYLIKLRLGKAEELLRQSAYSVTEIALSLGYPDLYSFSRAFYNYYGVSPSGYAAQADEGSSRAASR
ncbi:HTH-type transcriptional activator Btr [Paenibacillus solanacearum]|uniref:HTH-type transcriptional activator Btr n=1 Tax=Paenibacillus solanacearum TaxID=2048548 RepID=A0A916JVN4_9BACL|nr:AraC family transcriptional regulator [Paenibacillus solanacearum]CAG7607499.1 HTH-type transcriptional activator Btr [Paenibacillus solanacearum]